MDPVETVTVLFTDLVGSTGMAVRIGPAAAEEIRRDHFGTAVPRSRSRFGSA